MSKVEKHRTLNGLKRYYREITEHAEVFHFLILLLETLKCAWQRDTSVSELCTMMQGYDSVAISSGLK